MITCDDCGDPEPTTYKTIDLETFKCAFCGSRNIVKGDYSTIKHDIPDGDIDEEENNN